MGKSRFRATVLVALVASLGLVACTAITGLNGLQESACFSPGSCVDGSTVNPSTADASTDDASTDGAPFSAPDTGPLADDGPAPDATPGMACDPGTMLCGAGCVSPTDVHYCGSCTNDCTTLANIALGGDAGAITCVAGHCTYECAAGFADCEDANTGCATSLGSTTSCGACGVACTATDPLCAPRTPDAGAGSNACSTSCPAASPTVCNGSCVNEQTSDTSCGGCGAAFACATGKTCVAGQCVGPVLSISPTNDAFPATTLGQTSAAVPFVVSNTGNGASGTLTTALAGANAAEFAITTNQCTGHALAAGGSCTIDVTFTPTSRGPSAASLNVNGGQIFAAVTGSGQDTVALTVTKSGAGGGTVSGGPIACGSTCQASVARTTTTNPVVTLTAAPNGTSTFGGWSGACSGTSTTCNVTMSQAQTVNAEFDQQTIGLTVVARAFGSATGTISSSPAGISCKAPCTQTANFAPGTVVTLTTTGGPNVWWGSSQCTGSTCATTVSGVETVTATFSNNNYVFGTSNVYAGNLGGLSGGDSICAQAAKNAGLPGTYVAWLTTSTTTALSRLGSARGWIRTDGLPVADTVGTAGGKTGIRNGQIFYAPGLTEFGTANGTGSSLGAAWTGANEDGSIVTSPGNDDCDDWTNSTSSFNGAGGFPTYGSAEWTYNFVTDCTYTASVYCFGVDLSNPVTVPAPTGRIAFLSNGTFNPASGLAAADSLCQSEASTDGFSAASTFLAFLPSTAASALSRFSLSGSIWQRPDGIPLASSPSGLTNTLLAPPTQRGDGSYLTSVAQDYAWVGSSSANTAGTSTSTCSNWATNASSTNGTTGNPGSPYNWLNSSSDPCSDALPVYCFQP